MCLAIPLRIQEINGNEAVGERDGITRKIRIDFVKEPAVGDYVIVHAGFAIEKLNAKEAQETVDAFRELEDALRS